MVNRLQFRSELQIPLLVWEAPPDQKQELVFGTEAGAPMIRPLPGEPLVFELRKEGTRGNAFMMGVTVGRVETNDVVLGDNSVSRFHAYFQQDPRTKIWSVVDAESKNGSWLGPMKLAPNRPLILPDHSRLRFGHVDVIYFLPDSFVTYLQSKTS